MKKTGKVGNYLKALLPFVVMLLIQMAVAIRSAVSYMLSYGMEKGEQMYQENLGSTLLMSQLVTLLVMAVWYYLAVIHKRKKEGLPDESLFGWKSTGGLFLLAVGTYLFSAALLILWEIIAPGLSGEYEIMMQEAEMDSMTFLSFATAVVGAPLVEELIFRGLTLQYLKRTGAAFWTVNVIQAFLFALGHLNLIQGSYAFLMGLLSGWLVMKYRSLWSGILLHTILNFTGILLPQLADMALNRMTGDLTGEPGLALQLGAAAIAILLGAAAYWFGFSATKRDLAAKETADPVCL